MGRMANHEFDIFVESMAAELARSDMFADTDDYGYGDDLDEDEYDDDDLFGEEDDDDEDLDMDELDVESIYAQIVSLP